MPHELLDPATLRRFYVRRDRMQRAWPILCTSCGAEFIPGRLYSAPSRVRRSPTCRRGRSRKG